MTRLLIPLAFLLALAVLLGCTADPPFQHDATGTARPDGLLLAAYHRPPPPVYGARTGTRVPMAAPTTTTVTVTSTTVTSRPPRPAMWQPPNPGRWSGLLATCPWDQRTAAFVLNRESGGDPYAVNPHPIWLNGRWVHADGLMQILGGPLDPAANIAAACAMWRQRGWQPWGLG